MTPNIWRITPRQHVGPTDSHIKPRYSITYSSPTPHTSLAPHHEVPKALELRVSYLYQVL